jgi:glycosyltransferase involved in cell wall biosynthesis
MELMNDTLAVNVSDLQSKKVADKREPCLHVAVVIPVWNARQYLEICLDSILAAAEHSSGVDVTVIDNGSTDGSYEFLQSRYSHRIRVLQKRAVPVGALRNYAARHSSGEILCFVDADCRVSEDFFVNLPRVFKDVECDATGSTCQLPEKSHWIETTWHRLHCGSNDGYARWINAGNFVVSRKAFEQVGGFDETLITCEDKQLGHKLWSAGYKVFESHAVGAVHLGNPKSAAQFFRQQIWHGLGEFRLAREQRLRKPFLGTLGHACCLAAGLLSLLFAPVPAIVRVGVLVACWTAVPAAATLFRRCQRGSIRRPFAATLLYFLYFTGRGYGLLLLACGTYLTRSQNTAWRRR